jgi:hypothetical protein
MMTAPSEIRKATGIVPCAGAGSGLGAAFVEAESGPGVGLFPNRARRRRIAEEGIAATTPAAADLSRNSRRFIVMALLST